MPHPLTAKQVRETSIIPEIKQRVMELRNKPLEVAEKEKQSKSTNISK